MPAPVFNHFQLLRFRPAWWERPQEERTTFLHRERSRLAGELESVAWYRVFPTRSAADLLLWSAAPADTDEAVAASLTALGDALAPWRRWVEPVASLWGLTRSSPYTAKESSRTIDPLCGARRPCLIVYPFVKTPEWYLLEEEERRRLMGEHIQIGRRHTAVDQLLLYSFGMQDQEFVVAYETADLRAYSELVRALRGTVVRRYTRRDTPVWTGLHLGPDELEGAR